MTLDKIKGFIGDLARPFAIYVTSAASAIGLVIVALRVENGNDGAIFFGSVGVLIGLLIGARAAENINAAINARKVEVAKVQSPTEPTP